METPKVICPVCGGEVKEVDCYDHGIYLDETVEHYTGICQKCGETVDYDFIYPHKNPKIEIIDHYKD